MDGLLPNLAHGTMILQGIAFLILFVEFTTGLDPKPLLIGRVILLTALYYLSSYIFWPLVVILVLVAAEKLLPPRRWALLVISWMCLPTIYLIITGDIPRVIQQTRLFLQPFHDIVSLIWLCLRSKSFWLAAMVYTALRLFWMAKERKQYLAWRRTTRRRRQRLQREQVERQLALLTESEMPVVVLVEDN